MGKNNSPRALFAWVMKNGTIALSVIVLITCLSTYLVYQSFVQSENAAKIVNVAGKQRMLSQKVALYASHTLLAKSNLEKSLALQKFVETLGQINRSHRDLKKPDQWFGLGTDINPIIRDAYTSGEIDLDNRIAEMTQLVRSVLDEVGAGIINDTSTFADLNTSIAKGFLPAQDAMVSLYVSEAENIQFKVKMSILATFCLSIVTLAIIWKFMLRPFARELEEKAHEVEFMSEKLKSAAVHDSLTGLPNRTFMREHIERELANAKRHASKLAIVHLDLDFFKEINDTYGHSAGDQTLVETGKRIQSCIRTNDIVSRVGGDEFVLILSDFDDIGTVNIVLQRIRQRVSEPFIYEGASLQMSCSMGVAIYPDDAVTGDELIVNADLALYQVKEIGRGDFAFFSQGMRDELERRKTVELDLKDAVEKQELVPHFQPQVCVKTSRIIGVEALVRWEHSERGNIAPAEFLPVAEASGIMPKLGRSVMRMAMETAAKWHNEGLEMGRIGLNVSSPELAEPDFADWIINTAAEIGLPTSKISIEIIETVMLDDQRLDASRKLQQLRDADIHVELDDFGTGYASLCQINAGEVDRLKIDRQFVKNIDSDGDNAKIVGAVVRLATGLGIDIVAEGAETPSEVERLKELGCDRIQGFGIALPMPAKEASEWIGAFSKGRSTRKRALKKIA